MSDLRQAAQQALETFERMGHEDSVFAGEFDGEITALRAALAEPEQEPVGYWDGKFSPDGGATLYEVPQISHFGRKYPNIPVYAAPTPRKPLTEEEIAAIASTPCAVVGSYVHTFARAIERAHGIGEQQ